MTNHHWRPSATIINLQQRAALLTQVRAFFAERNVLEVETPLLAQYSVTDPYMDVITAENPLGSASRYFFTDLPRIRHEAFASGRFRFYLSNQ